MPELESSTPQEPTVVGSVRQLAVYLRENPRARVEAPALLAGSYQLEPGLVCSILEGVRQAARTSAKPRVSLRENFSIAAAAVNKSLTELTDDPQKFILFSSLALIVSVTIPVWFSRIGGVIWWIAAICVFLQALSYFVLQTVCVWRAGRIGYAWLSSALACIAWAAIAFAAGLPSLFQRGGNLLVEVGTRFVLATLVAFTILILQGMFFTVVALLGGYHRYWRIDRETQNLSRQDAIKRVLELQARIRTAAPESPVRARFRRVRTRFRQNSQFLALLGGASLGVATIFLHHGVDSLDGVGVIALGVLSPGPGTALVLGLAFALPKTILAWLPYHPLQHLPSMAGDVISLGVLAGVVGFIAFIYEMASRERRFRNNEINALVEELVRVEWKLQEAANWVTAISIDAAGSTRMKMGAEPLMVEYSFRAYQAWIAEIVREEQGIVQATAGDGAIVSFHSASHALIAAKKLQSSIAEFNADRNLLPTPFRIRIGMHRGQVAGALGEVQFTNVIDIACHIEKIAPVGGIAISGPAYDEAIADLPNERALELADAIDGQRVFVIQNTGE